MENNIIHYCNIKNNEVFLDGKKLYSGQDGDQFLDFIKGVYKNFELNYPKFYKMDPLCKLAITASSILLDGIDQDIDPDMGLLLSNKSSCYKSEEHTSELQSRPHLVCRLLLEKKKK